LNNDLSAEYPSDESGLPNIIMHPSRYVVLGLEQSLARAGDDGRWAAEPLALIMCKKDLLNTRTQQRLDAISASLANAFLQFANP
jgi:hypothetical protein